MPHMRHRMSVALLSTVLLTFAATTLQGCSRSRADALRDRSESLEQKLVAERVRAAADANSADRDARMSHLQSLRMSLSLVNVSIASVPHLLKDEGQRDIGYSVLDEALGTIDWNIPLYAPTATQSARPYPTLFSPQIGLNFDAIRRGEGPRGIAQ